MNALFASAFFVNEYVLLHLGPTVATFFVPFKGVASCMGVPPAWA